MKEIRSIGLLAMALTGLALVGGVVYGVSRLENKTITALAAVLVGGAVLALIIFVSSFPIRAWRREKPPPPERQLIRETKIIDGRPHPAPQVIQAQPAMGPVLPELLRAAYAAGTRQGLPSGVADYGRDEHNEPVGTGWSDVWDGQVLDDEDTVDSPFTRRTR